MLLQTAFDMEDYPRLVIHHLLGCLHAAIGLYHTEFFANDSHKIFFEEFLPPAFGRSDPYVIVVSCTHGHYYVPFERYPTLEN
jgi:hypothetical protein